MYRLRVDFPPATVYKLTAEAGAFVTTGQAADFVFGGSPSGNTPPYWLSPSAADLGTRLLGDPHSIPLASYAMDDEGDPIAWTRTGGTAPAGVVIDADTGVLTIPDSVSAGDYTVIIDIASAATPVVALGLVDGGDGKAWTFGQVFEQGDAPAEIELAAITGTLSAWQADVRNRWSDGSVKFAVLSGIGGTSVQVNSTSTAPSAGSVALGAVSASVTISGVVDYVGASVLAGPVTVTMPTSATAAVFGASPASHTAGLVRSIPGPVMTEYHYYSPVPGDPHLAVWWYVRAYSNGAREVETQVECTPWVSVAGGGRRDYTASVSVGGSERMVNTAVQHYARTAWSRVDWVGAAPQVKPRHDSTYLRRYAFPYNNLATPNPNALNYGMAAIALVANSYAEAMAPPVNNPGSQLQWPNEVGATGTGGMLRTNIEAAYAAGADVYWSAEAHARSAGRYPLHVRDPITGRPWNVVRNPSIRNGQSYTGGFWSENAGLNAAWKLSHAAPLGSGAYLLSGRYSFMERMQQQSNAQALSLYQLPDSSRYGYAFGGPYTSTSITPDVRNGAWLQWGYVNQTAWSPETLGGAALTTYDDELRTAVAPYIEHFVEDMRDAFVTGTIEGGIYQNALGCVSWSPGYLGNYSTSENAWGDNFMQTYVCFVLDAALDLDLPISAGAKTAHQQLYNFAMSRVVALHGTWGGSGWNYRYYSQHLPAGPRDPDGVLRYPPQTWFTTYSELWTALLIVRGTGTINEINLSDANGGNLTNYYSTYGYVQEAEFPRSSINLTDNTLQQFSSLALAVDRGVAGAQAAWTRLQSSPTLLAPATVSNFKDYPATCFTPRTL